MKVLYSQRGAASVAVLNERGFVCEAVSAENFRMIGEDEERLEAHLAMQARTRRTKLEALRVPAERVRMLDEMATEAPDMAQGATISSIVHGFLRQ